MSLKNLYKKNMSRGFTLIELVVVVTIMLIMTTVVIFNYNSFNESMLLNNFAYDMSLTIRQAQVYGVAVKETPGTSIANQIDVNSHNNNFSYAYGVHFSSVSDSNTSFNLFVDSGDGNGGMADGFFQSTESLQSYTFQKGIKIRELCITTGANGTTCSSAIGTAGTNAGSAVSNLDITFLRPNPDAIIHATDNYGFLICDPDNGVICSSATIVLQNANDTINKAIVISSTGQISVQAAHH